MKTESELVFSFRRKPEDLSREVVQIQQRELSLKQQNYTLTSK